MRTVVILALLCGCGASQRPGYYKWEPYTSGGKKQAVAACKAVRPGDMAALEKLGELDLRGHVWFEKPQTGRGLCAKHGGTHMVQAGSSETGTETCSRGFGGQVSCHKEYSDNGWAVYRVRPSALAELPKHLRPAPLAKP